MLNPTFDGALCASSRHVKNTSSEIVDDCNNRRFRAYLHHALHASMLLYTEKEV